MAAYQYVVADRAEAQDLRLKVLPRDSANAGGTVTTGSGGTGKARLSLYDSGGVSLGATYTDMAPSYDTGRKELYHSLVFPLSVFPVGTAYIARWSFAVTGGSASPEAWQRLTTLFDVVAVEARPPVNETDIWAWAPTLQQFAYADTAPEVDAVIMQAWAMVRSAVAAATGGRPEQVLNSDDWRLPTILKTCAMLSRMHGLQAEAEHWQGEYTTAIRDALRFAHRDTDDSGVPDTTAPVSPARLIF